MSWTRGYRSIVGGVAWPWGTKPGWVVVLAEEHVPDKDTGKRHVHVLAEMEHMEAEGLYEICKRMLREHGCGSFYGDIVNPLARIFVNLDRQAGLRRQRPVRMAAALLLEDPRALSAYAQLVRERMQSGRRSLHYGRQSVFPVLLANLDPDAVEKKSFREVPALAALGFGLVQLDMSVRPAGVSRQRSEGLGPWG